MNGTTRIALTAALHPVRHAAEALGELPGGPTLAGALEALERLQTETARAATLVRHLADEHRE
ncbi:hypothetical protein ACIBEJ_45245 [Nonomuraea sp. NPDC050790]|uniref:hypothetical protein n=1 Tax=Nonomuraea sp. NPDC050790 TaxID=3364371 RepID=UPI0037943CED